MQNPSSKIPVGAVLWLLLLKHFALHLFFPEEHESEEMREMWLNGLRTAVLAVLRLSQR